MLDIVRLCALRKGSTSRRNIILHNLGVVNEEYRKKTGYKGKEERLTVSEDYLEKSIHMFRLMGSKLANEFYSKFAVS